MTVPEYDLGATWDKHLVDSRNAPKDYVSKPGLKPSELGSPCLRKNYYVYWKVPSNFPWELDNILAAEAGDAFHAMIRKHLKDAGLLIENLDKKGRVPISFIDGKTPDPEFPIFAQDLGVRYAKADGIVEIPPGFDKSGFWVAEIKSKKTKQFVKVKGPERDRYQGTLYPFLLEEAMREGNFDHIPRLKGCRELRGTVYIYMDRETGERKIYWEEKDPVVLESIIAKCLLLLDYAEKKQLPPKTKDFCPWCSWRDKCEIEWNVE